MIRFVFRFSLSSLSLCAVAAMAADTPISPSEEIAQKVPQALEIIKAWRQPVTQVTEQKRMLHIVYWTPSDRSPAPKYRERLTRTMLHIQQFYAKEMKRLGFGPQTINLDMAQDKQLKIHLVQGPNPYAIYKPSDGQKIRKECLPVLKAAGVDAANETIVIFCNMSNWDSEKRIITQNSPYYAGGTHRNGCAWQVDSPILDPVFLDQKEQKLRDGQYGKISLGRYNSIFVGGVCHELGHALGLPHNCARKDESQAWGTALMGSGNRSYGEELRGESKGSFLTLAHGLRLTTHPMFSGTTQGMPARGTSKLTEIDIKAGSQSIQVTGRVKHQPGSPPVYAVLAYFDPAGGGNYDATTATAIPASDGTFSLSSSDLKPNKSGSLRLIALYANGDATSHIGTRSPYTYPYNIDRDGKPHLDTLNFVQQFEPAQAAVKARKPQQIEAELKKLNQSDNPKTSAIAKRLLARGPIHPAPAKVGAEVTSIALSDTTPSSAKVGYFQPTYNRLPSGTLLLQSSGQIFTSGIYAHAPARHVYALDGQWKKLAGTCGLAQEAPGSIVFVIKADGKEIWRSRLVKPGQLKHYDVDLSGKKNLELLVEDGGNGTGSDWGLWLEPMLTR